MLETCASSDLAFLLIIYFLVIAGFNTNIGFLVSLPEKGKSLTVAKEALLRFDMDNQGTVFHNGVALTLLDAEQTITDASGRNPNLALLLSIDGKAPWQNVVLFTELAQKLSVSTFSFTMKEEQ